MPRHPAHAGTWRGIALVELLAVITVMGLLLVLLIPSVRRSMRQASSTVCMHNLQEINMALHSYRLDHRGWLPDVVAPAVGKPADPHGAAWYGRLVPRYLGHPSVLGCPADPASPVIDPRDGLIRHPDPANASSYGMNDIIRAAGLQNLDRHGPAVPLETILLADMGPDLLVDRRVKRNNGWLPWDDAYHPAVAGLRDSWLTGRHFGHINVLTVGGSVKQVRTVELMEDRITNFYGQCASGGCPLCNDYALPHYSFAPDRLFWWTGSISVPD
ncbi:MAG: hypothetical protein V3W34_10175 [Phycisphaerae bacterium]